MDSRNEPSPDAGTPEEATETEEQFFANIGHKLDRVVANVNDRRAAVLRLAMAKMPEGVALDKMQNQLLAMEIAELKILIFGTILTGEDSERIQDLYHFALFSKYLAWLKETESELIRQQFTVAPNITNLR